MLAMLVKDCLAKRPADRPQTAGEVMQILDAIATPSGGTAATTVVRPATPTPRSRRWPLLASAAMLAVLLGGGAMWLRRNRPASSSPQVAPAVDHTRAILSPVESANTRPPATAAAEPLLDPPVKCSGCQGLRAGGHGRSKAGPPVAVLQGDGLLVEEAPLVPGLVHAIRRHFVRQK